MAPEEFNRRILLVTNDLGPHAGGIETFILGLIDQLDGRDIVIYTSTEPGCAEFDLKLSEKTGVVVIRDKSKTLLPTRRVTKNVIKVMKKYKSEVIWFGAAAPLALMAQRLKDVGAKKTIALTHGHEVWWAKVFPFNLAMRKIGTGCDVVTYLGTFTREAIAKSLGSNPNLVHLAPGIDLDQFSPRPKSLKLIKDLNLDNSSIILCVGRLVSRKGQDRLIEALPIVKKKITNVQLVIVGGGRYQAKLMKIARKFGVIENIKFVGRVPFNKLPQYFALGDVFAMPARNRIFGLEVEGLGIVYLEASACGIPVIAGNSGGAPDAVLVGKTGYVVDGNNVNEIATHLIKLLSNKDLSRSLGANGREWVSKNWTWELWGSRFSDLLIT